MCGPNKGRLDRKAAAIILGWSKEEISKAYNNWIQIFRKEGSTLTFSQYCDKMKEAGIGPADVGNGRERFHLARFNDEGPYSKESCRFVPGEVNFREQKRVAPFDAMVKKYGRDEAIRILTENGRKSQFVRRKQTGLADP